MGRPQRTVSPPGCMRGSPASIDSRTSRRATSPRARSYTRGRPRPRRVSVLATLRCACSSWVWPSTAPTATPSTSRFGRNPEHGALRRPAVARPALPARPHHGLSDRTPLAHCVVPRPCGLGAERGGRATSRGWPCLGLRLLVSRARSSSLQYAALGSRMQLLAHTPWSYALRRPSIHTPQPPRVSGWRTSPSWTDHPTA